jgi:hypothetical protein
VEVANIAGRRHRPLLGLIYAFRLDTLLGAYLRQNSNSQNEPLWNARLAKPILSIRSLPKRQIISRRPRLERRVMRCARDDLSQPICSSPRGASTRAATGRTPSIRWNASRSPAASAIAIAEGAFRCCALFRCLQDGPGSGLIGDHHVDGLCTG